MTHPKKKTSKLFALLVGMVAAMMAVFSCNSTVDRVSFESQWEEMNNRTWAGSAWWANRLQDWRIHEGKLECLHQGNDRNVHLLTHQLQPRSTLQMEVTVSRPVNDFNGWVGFRFASHGNIDEYRHNVVNSTSGLNARLKTDGTLLLGKDSLMIDWPEQVRLSLELSPKEANHTALFEVQNTAGEVLGRVEATFDTSRIHGNLALVCHSNTNRKESHGEPVAAFSDFKLTGSSLRGGKEQRWGPILWSQYTVDEGIMRLSAQFPPLGPDDDRLVILETDRGGGWQQAAQAQIDDMARVAFFRIDNWNEAESVPYRLVYQLDDEKHTYEGVIRKNPLDQQEISVAAFTGNKDYGFPNTPIIRNLQKLDPDLLFFSGDQIYETVGGYGIVRHPVDQAILDYLRKWYLLGWSFGDLLKNRPSVIIPDDHDVYQGNLWGQGGRRIPGGENFRYGGYVMDPEWVKMVQRTQTVHLPDPYDPTPAEQDISVYYTDLEWGGVSFAILEDRKFKWGTHDVDPKNPDRAQLLGERQLDFLEHWVGDWEDVRMKATLSQTVFAQCHTHSGPQAGVVDATVDANGWPPEKRDKALRTLRKGYAFMLAGDNHLPTVVHHGIDTWEDAGISFTVPSIAAGWPRAWWPDKAEKKRYSGYPDYAKQRMESPDAPDYIGRYMSGWGHPITMLAAANPEVIKGHWQTRTGDFELLQQKRSGFGLVRFNTQSRDITMECYPVGAKIKENRKDQYRGWPVTISQRSNYGREIAGYLPKVSSQASENPVLKVIRETDQSLVYAIRLKENVVRPWVFEPGSYTVMIGDPETGEWEKMENQTIEK